MKWTAARSVSRGRAGASSRLRSPDRRLQSPLGRDRSNLLAPNPTARYPSNRSDQLPRRCTIISPNRGNAALKGDSSGCELYVGKWIHDTVAEFTGRRLTLMEAHRRDDRHFGTSLIAEHRARPVRELESNPRGRRKADRRCAAPARDLRTPSGPGQLSSGAPAAASDQPVPPTSCAGAQIRKDRTANNQGKDQDRPDERRARTGRGWREDRSWRGGQARTCRPDQAAASRARSSRRFMFARSVALIFRCAMPSHRQPSARSVDGPVTNRSATPSPHVAAQRLGARWARSRGPASAHASGMKRGHEKGSSPK